MAIAFDAADGRSGRVSSLSWAHACSGNDRILIIAVSHQYGAMSITSVKYNGVNLSHLITKTSTQSESSIYYMLDPPIGSHTVLVTASSASFYVCAHAISYTGVLSIDNGASGGATSTHPAVSIAGGGSGYWCIAVEGAYGSDAETITDNAGQTRRSTQMPAVWYRSAYSDDSINGAIGWTLSHTEEWTVVGARLTPVLPKVFTRVAGVWRNVKTYARVSGTWRSCKVWVKVGAVWTLIG